MSSSNSNGTFSFLRLLLAVAGLGVAIATPEIRCLLGLESQSCPSWGEVSPSQPSNTSLNTPQASPPAKVVSPPVVASPSPATQVSPSPDASVASPAEPSPTPTTTPDIFVSSSPNTPENAAENGPPPYLLGKKEASKAESLSQSAKTAEDWQKVGQQWQKAEDLMVSVPSSSPNYEAAQGKISDYRQQQQAALGKAEQLSKKPS